MAMVSRWLRYFPIGNSGVQNMAYDRIVLAIPHATRIIQSQEWSDRELVERDADRWTDWRTDELFECRSARIFTVFGGVSRFDVDLERLENDPLEAAGQGRLYTRSHSGAVRTLTDSRAGELIGMWSQYRTVLSNLLVEQTLLIDCHSFPEDVSPIDICIGCNQDWSCPSDVLIERIERYFTRLGYRVGINDPYSNSITPSESRCYQSLMIEVNKKTYLDDQYRLSESGILLRGELHKLYARLLGELPWD
jgi:N-formylglutamate amidohydrolase